MYSFTLTFIFFNPVIIKHLLGLSCVPGDPDTVIYELQGRLLLCCLLREAGEEEPLRYLSSGSPAERWRPEQAPSLPALFPNLGSLSGEATACPQVSPVATS